VLSAARRQRFYRKNLRRTHMPTKISRPTIIPAEGNLSKEIAEYVGRVNSATAEVSIARMLSPPGWIEPSQRPDFNEYTVVLKGMLQVEVEGETFAVFAGEAIIAYAGELVRYSSPGPDGAEYIAVCLPAFSPETVNRKKD
jgi:mannose-6-phosphate isomerase-like protein (cupin superfamily)